MGEKRKPSIKKHSIDILKVKSLLIRVATNYHIICQLPNLVNNWEIFSNHDFFMIPSDWCKSNLSFYGIWWTSRDHLTDEWHNDQHYRNYGIYQSIFCWLKMLATFKLSNFFKNISILVLLAVFHKDLFQLHYRYWFLLMSAMI